MRTRTLSGYSGTWEQGREPAIHCPQVTKRGLRAPPLSLRRKMMHPPNVDTLAPKHLAQSKVRTHSDSIESCAQSLPNADLIQELSELS